MIFLDANVVIYAFKPEYAYLLQRLASTDESLACSDMVRLEVLGFRWLSPADADRISAFFSSVTVLPISGEVISAAVGLRQQKAIGSPDAIIAATALLAGGELWTTNVGDFEWIQGLRWRNPLERV